MRIVGRGWLPNEDAMQIEELVSLFRSYTLSMRRLRRPSGFTIHIRAIKHQTRNKGGQRAAHAISHMTGNHQLARTLCIPHTPYPYLINLHYLPAMIRVRYPLPSNPS